MNGPSKLLDPNYFFKTSDILPTLLNSLQNIDIVTCPAEERVVCCIPGLSSTCLCFSPAPGASWENISVNEKVETFCEILKLFLIFSKFFPVVFRKYF